MLYIIIIFNQINLKSSKYSRENFCLLCPMFSNMRLFIFGLAFVFKISYRLIQKNSKELWKTLKSLGLNPKKVSQSKIWLKEDDFIQFELKKMQIFLKLSIMSWQGTKSKNYQSPFSNLLQKNLRYYIKN